MVLFIDIFRFDFWVFMDYIDNNCSSLSSDLVLLVAST